MFRVISIALLAIAICLVPCKIVVQGNLIAFAEAVAYSDARIAPIAVERDRFSYVGAGNRILLSDVKPRKYAKTVVEVVLNEMAGSAVVGRANAFEDALSIASVIANRATAVNMTQQAVASVRQEFNGFGIRMRPGAERDMPLAARAVEYVARNGPVHGGIFYATPACVDNLPKGLLAVTRTAGHVFFIDPDHRSFKTTHGYVRPDPRFSSFLSTMLRLKPTAQSWRLHNTRVIAL